MTFPAFLYAFCFDFKLNVIYTLFEMRKDIFSFGGIVYKITAAFLSCIFRISGKDPKPGVEARRRSINQFAYFRTQARDATCPLRWIGWVS